MSKHVPDVCSAHLLLLPRIEDTRLRRGSERSSRASCGRVPSWLDAQVGRIRRSVGLKDMARPVVIRSVDSDADFCGSRWQARRHFSSARAMSALPCSPS